MDHDDILEMMMETIMEMEMAIECRAKARQEREKFEFGFGYSIVTIGEVDEAA